MRPWIVDKGGDEPIQVHPAGDTREHVLCPDGGCWCEPDLDFDDDGEEMWVHNAQDQREKYETGERRVS